MFYTHIKAILIVEFNVKVGYSHEIYTHKTMFSGINSDGICSGYLAVYRGNGVWFFKELNYLNVTRNIQLVVAHDIII